MSPSMAPLLPLSGTLPITNVLSHGINPLGSIRSSASTTANCGASRSLNSK